MVLNPRIRSCPSLPCPYLGAVRHKGWLLYIYTSYHNYGMVIDDWLALPSVSHAVRMHADAKLMSRLHVPDDDDAVKSFLSNIMVQDAALLRLDPAPTDYDIVALRSWHLELLEYFVRCCWDVPKEAQV